MSHRATPPVNAGSGVTGQRIAAAVAVVLVLAAGWAMVSRLRPKQPAAPATTAISVVSEPAGAEAYLDDELLGRTPVTRVEVAQGEHVLVVTKQGYDPYRVRVLVGERQNVLSVPAAAIQYSHPGDAFVSVRAADGSWQDQPVRTGMNDGIMVEILSGLEEGQTVSVPVFGAWTPDQEGVAPDARPVP